MALLLLATALVANPFEALFDTSIKDFFSVTEAVHHGFRCDASGKTPIVGTRYHLTGRKRDLCESEWLKLSEEERPSTMRSKRLYLVVALRRCEILGQMGPA